jgi:signal transduction histidine kinase
MDIKVAITRTGLFIAIYAIILGLPIAGAFWFKPGLISLFGANWWLASLVLTAALATSGPFVYIRLQKKVESTLLKEQRKYQETLKQASVGMTRIRNLHKLLDLIAHIVTRTVKISYAAVYLYDKQTDEFIVQVSRDRGRSPLQSLKPDNPLIQWLRQHPEPLIYEEVKRLSEDRIDPLSRALEESMRALFAAVVIPSFLGDKFIAFFVLGDKLSGEIYTPEDINVFEVLASQAALSIENAQFYEDAKEMQEQIAQAEKMATIGTMADGLSHQINNRFNALALIAGDTIDTLKVTDASGCTPQVQEMLKSINYALERIQANVVQGGEVVRGILKYSRKGSTTDFEAIDLNKLLDSTLDMLRFKVKLTEIELVRNFSADIPKIKGNFIQLQEAFFNLIDNAYDAAVERRDLKKEEGFKGRITISAAGKDANLEIVIEDNGIGVKDEDRKKLFTPFFTTKISARKGTGLGLYVIRRIISDAHKGKISFDSAYMQGSRFTIELPAA